MNEMHIPDEVVEAGAKAIYEHYLYDGMFESGRDWGSEWPPIRQDACRELSRAALRAALAAWVGTGMARLVTEADDHNRTGKMIYADPFPVLIIRVSQ